MDIIKQQLQITLNKTELATIINSALLDETAGPSIKRALSSIMGGAFPQFPEHTAVTLGETHEDGTTVVVLKVPVLRAAKPTDTIDEPFDDEPITKSNTVSDD